MIVLDWPPASLSGHNNGNPFTKAKDIKAHRWHAKIEAARLKASIPADGDIRLKVTFVPPDNRSDRLNMPNRLKAYFDGMADAWGVNDKRFAIPEYHVAAPEKPGRVVVEVLP